MTRLKKNTKARKKPLHPILACVRTGWRREVLAVLLLLALTACGPGDHEPQQKAAPHQEAVALSGQIRNSSPTDNSVTKPLLKAIDHRLWGIDFTHDAGFSEKYSIYEPLGSGVATLDINNDGWWDLFFPQYGQKGHSSRLYLNQQGKGFRDVTAEAGLNGLRGLIFAAAADANNDGQTDILAGGENRLSLWLNQGDGRFVPSAAIASPGGEQFFSGASWFDAEGDGWLDAWVSNYVDGSQPTECLQASGRQGYCPPSAYPDRTDLFFQNQHGKAFYPYPGIIIKPRAGLSVVAADFDNNGWPDIYVANDEEANQLFLNSEGVFGPDEALRRGAGLNLMGETEASMGVAAGDIDGNGFPDLYLTHYRNESNTIYYNQHGQFVDRTAQHGLASAARPMTGFGTVFTDLNGDNRLDIVTVNGSVVTVEEDPEHTNGRLHAEPVQVWLNTPSGFAYQDALTESLPRKVGRGLIAVDWDNDGDKDLVISNNNQPPTVLRNTTDPDNWTGLELRCHNRQAIGAKLELVTTDGHTLHRAVHADGSYASSGDPRIVLYQTQAADRLRIRWPEGQTQELTAGDLMPQRYNRLECPGPPPRENPPRE